MWNRHLGALCNRLSWTEVNFEALFFTNIICYSCLGVVTADDEQTSQQQQFSQSGSLNDRGVIFGQVDAQQQQSATGSINVNNSISETAKLVSAQLSSVVYDQQQQCKQQQQQQSLECSENGVLLESSGGGGPSSIPQGN